jgi:prepilin-type N-terminal cleavage/methylation domain-containing protein
MTTNRSIVAGFTLIETLVAILILSIAIVGPLTIASRGLGAALVSKDETTAYYLAQDAIEYVRFKRDSNRLAGIVDPLMGLDGSNGCTSTQGCTVDSITDTVSACNGTCTALKYDPTSYSFNYDTGGSTVFVRTVQITTPVCAPSGTPCNSDESKIVVKVAWWDVGGAQHTVQLLENLLNWQ